MAIYRWQNELWQGLTSMRDRMPHALLLQGRTGIGKLDFASALAQSLLCDTPEPDLQACGTCDSCNWYSQGNHPDFRTLEPLESGSSGEDEAEAKPGKKSQVIAVDQVRELAEFLGLSSHRAGLRIVLLHPAEALNPASANALLKMLEEPPPQVLFLLVTHNPQRLLPTIKSRCIKIDMPFAAREEAEAWLAGQGIKEAAQRLAYAGGAPLQVLREEEGVNTRLDELQAMLGRAQQMDPFAAATLCSKEGIGYTVDVLQRWTHDLASVRLAGEIRYHASQSAPLQDLAKAVDLPKLLDYQQLLHEARRSAQHPLNADLQVESLMIQYTQLFATTSRP